jgi:hypothetical protein
MLLIFWMHLKIYMHSSSMLSGLHDLVLKSIKQAFAYVSEIPSSFSNLSVTLQETLMAKTMMVRKTRRLESEGILAAKFSPDVLSELSFGSVMLEVMVETLLIGIASLTRNIIMCIEEQEISRSLFAFPLKSACPFVP